MNPTELIGWADATSPPPIPDNLPPGMATIYSLLVPIAMFVVRYVLMQIKTTYLPLARQWLLDFRDELDKRRAANGYGEWRKQVKVNTVNIAKMAELSYTIDSFRRENEQLRIENDTLKASIPETMARIRKEHDERMIEALRVLDEKLDAVNHKMHDDRNEPTRDWVKAIDVIADEAKNSGIKPGTLTETEPPTPENNP